MANGLRIGLFGGSFNPAHSGHLYVGLTALKRLRLDYVWWLVSPGNPLKRATEMAAFEKRLLAAQKIARDPRLIVSDLERQLDTRYTIDTVKLLQQRFPQVQFVWLMGSDNLENFHLWRDWQGIARAVPVAVVQRPGSIMAAVHAAPIRRFGARRVTDGKLPAPPAVLILDGARSPQSATRLRALGEG